METKNLEIRLVKNKKELYQVFKIRFVVFIKGQNVPKDIERDEFDKTAKHVILFYKNKPVGCARIRFMNGKAKLERIAVLKRYRGEGFGKVIVNYLVKYCKNRKIKNIYMNAQYYLKGYYRKFGFEPKGKPFMETKIKHIKMRLK